MRRIGDRTPQPFFERPPHDETRNPEHYAKPGDVEHAAQDQIRDLLQKKLAYEVREPGPDGAVTRITTKLQRNPDGRAGDDPILAYEDADGMQQIDTAQLTNLFAALDREREKEEQAKDHAALSHNPLLRQLPGEAEQKGN